MVNRVLRVTALLTTLLLLVSSHNTDAEEAFDNDMEPNIIKYLSDEELIHQIHSMMKAYREGVNNEQYIDGTSSPVDIKDKTWKRNADLINALLALPKGMTDAGR